MKYLTALLLSLVLVAGCSQPGDIDDDEFCPERPTANIPAALRQRNWIGEGGSGSCVYASMVSLLRWQERYAAADRIAEYGDGAGPLTLSHVLDAEGIRYVMTTDGDEAFLDWAMKTRRGCGICFEIPEGNHFVDLVYLDNKEAAILDNNDTGEFIWISRQELLEHWRALGGWAVTPLYAPMAPLPI